MKSDFIERRIKLNRNTTVTLRSKKDKDADIYRNTIVVTQESADIEPLKIATRTELEELIQGMDLQEDQLSILGGEKV